MSILLWTGKDYLGKSGLFRWCTFQRSTFLVDWPLTGSWGITSEFLEYSTWQVYFCMSESLGYAVLIWIVKFILTRWFILNACFCSGGWTEIWVPMVSHTDIAYLCDWPPIKASKARVSFLGWHTLFLVELGVSLCDFPEKGPLEACTWFLLYFPPCVFPFADCNLFLSL